MTLHCVLLDLSPCSKMLSINCGKNSLIQCASSTGHYLFIETSFVPSGYKAWLLGPPISPQAGKCFQFWYHMYGSSIGQLNVYILTTKTVPSTPVWSRQKDQGNFWYIAQISITQSSHVNVSSCTIMLPKRKLCTFIYPTGNLFE